MECPNIFLPHAILYYFFKYCSEQQHHIESPKESSIPIPSAPVYASSSRASLLAAERPISSLV